MIGIDVGYGFVKTYPGNIVFPSVFSDYVEREFLMPGNIMDNLEIEVDGIRCFVGNLAQLEGGTGTFDSFNMMRHKLSALTAISLLSDGNYSGKVVLGLPVADLKNHKSDLQKLKGVHEILFCGKKMTIELTEILVMPQGAATYFDLILSDEGKAIASDLVSKKVGIIDIGEKTLDFVMMDKNRFVGIKSGGNELGMSKAHLRLLPVIQRELGVSCMEHQVREYLGKIPGDAVAHYRRLAGEIVNDMGKKWNYRDVDVIYLTGGGGIALYNYIVERLPENVKCLLVPDGRFSNARGYLKCGLSVPC